MIVVLGKGDQLCELISIDLLDEFVREEWDEPVYLLDI